jgi:Rps23 Pro-64 3,4-dihydroxylase Tpa1-like proline 4-hydroxylase
MKEQLVEKIARRLNADAHQLQEQFHARKGPTRFFTVDDLLSEETAMQIHAAFPDPSKFRRFDSFRERKWTSKNMDAVPSILGDVTFAFQAPEIVEVVERITGIPKQVPDPHLYAGGLSMMTKGDFLNPHIDNSHDKDRAKYRTANLLYYVTPGWQSSNGGNFELWDAAVRSPIEVVSKFNRLLVMETHDKSWHSVNPVRADGTRCCVSNYYFSEVPPGGYPHFHITAFTARPEQKVRRLIASVDSFVRGAVRTVAKRGVGKSDIYKK